MSLGDAAEAKGTAQLKEAERILSFWSVMFSCDKTERYESAIECYEGAAQQFKMAKKCMSYIVFVFVFLMGVYVSTFMCDVSTFM